MPLTKSAVTSDSVLSRHHGRVVRQIGAPSVSPGTSTVSVYVRVHSVDSKLYATQLYVNVCTYMCRASFTSSDNNEILSCVLVFSVPTPVTHVDNVRLKAPI